MTEEIKFNEKLKQDTAGKHRQLEETELSKSMMSPALTLTVYNTYLQKMYSLVSLFEETYYKRLSTIVSDIEARKKAQNMLLDIERTGTALHKQPPIKWFNNNVSDGFLLGVLYVLEGSTLGGRFLFNNANKVLGLNEQTGAAYFAGYANETGTMWKSFIKNLNDYAAAHPGEQQDIIDGANFAFDAFHKQLS